MKTKVFMRSIRESFTTIFEKYHCMGVIMPLFLLMFLFNGLANTNIIPANASGNGLVERISAAIADEKQAAEKSIKLQKTEIANLPEETPKSTYAGRQVTAKNYARAASATTTSASVGYAMIIAGRTIPIFDTPGTTEDAGSRIAHTSGTVFYYGHRSTVFGFLAGLPSGTQFSIKIGDTINTYVIKTTVSLDNSSKSAINGVTDAGRAMGSLLNGTYHINRYTEKPYDAVLMTCDGVAGGGISGDISDAGSRIAVLAYEIL